MKREQQDPFDLLIVGGGINGAGIARDAAGRGLRCCWRRRTTSARTRRLVDQAGARRLRYLEHYEFGLVRKSLAEREVLLRNAPHIVWPLRFLIPHDPSDAAGVDDPHRAVPVRPPCARREILPARTGRPARQTRASRLKEHGAPGSCTPTAGSTTRAGGVNAVDAGARATCSRTAALRFAEGRL